MKASETRLDGIADITAPLVPPETGLDPLLLVVLACLLLALLTVAIVWRARRSPVGRARRELAELRATYRDKQISVRNASYRLAAILRCGLQRPAISSATQLPPRLQAQQQRWNSFITQLEVARYTRTACNEQQIESLFRHAQYWLRHW